MYRSFIESLFVLIVIANLGMAAPPAVGIVMASGSFTLDGSRVTGNATLFEGSQIETGTVSPLLQLNDGGKIQLGAESKATVYRDRLILERGSGRFENYIVEAFTLRIQPDRAAASAEVAVRDCDIAGAGTVRVAAFNGTVSVTTGKGVLLTNLQPGRTFDFVPQEAGIAGACGVAVTGIAPAAGAGAAAAGTGAASAPISTAAAVGMGVGAKVAIVAVVVAGAGAGAAVAVVKSNDEPAISPSTR